MKALERHTCYEQYHWLRSMKLKCYYTQQQGIMILNIVYNNKSCKVIHHVSLLTDKSESRIIETGKN